MMTDIHGPRSHSDARLTALIWASAMGAYLLLALGGATSLLEGGTACSTWPTCGPGIVGDLGDPSVLVALAHRLAAAVVGILFLGTLVVSTRAGLDRVSASILLATALYPFQVAIGALTVTRDVAGLSVLHFGLGVAIFGVSVVALTWHLEATTVDTASSDDSQAETGDSETPPVSTDQQSQTAPSGTTTGEPVDVSVMGRARAYLRLTKPRLMWLLALVAVAAMVLVAGRDLSPVTAVATVTGGMLAIGASGTFNNVLERDADKEMDRTADRPLVQGQISIWRATVFGLSLTALSMGVFVIVVNMLAAALTLLAIIYYSVIYTLVLKPHTRQNIVLGGAVGAFPALIGGAAVTNTIPLSTVALGGVIFLWTPAHFYNLALAYQDDYAAAGFPMLPVVRGEATTRRHILLYLGATLVGAVVLGAVTPLDWLYTVTMVFVGGVFMWTVVRQYREPTTARAFRTFHASNAYLGILLLSIVVESLLV